MQNHSPIQSYRASDHAVDGLLRGLAAGAAMMAVLVLATLASGGDWAAMVASFAAEGNVRPWNGMLAHLAISAIYGIFWGLGESLLLRNMTLPRWLWGAIYGLSLYAVAQLGILPGTALFQIPAALFLVAHVIYGVTLGLLQDLARAPARG